jgi:hypothetical protein
VRLRIAPDGLIGKAQQFAFLHFRAGNQRGHADAKRAGQAASKVAVGLLSPRSILWIIARETPARSASSLRDHPRDSRSRRILALIR